MHGKLFVPLSMARPVMLSRRPRCSPRLVTNAMVFAHADPELFLDTREGHIYVEVRDADSDPAVDRRGEEWAPRGWGLDMIDALATSWGNEWRADCDAVWFNLTF